MAGSQLSFLALPSGHDPNQCHDEVKAQTHKVLIK